MKRPTEAKNLISNVTLVILVVVSVFLAGAVAARYLTNGTGNDSARVAKWDVSATVTPPADAAKIIAADGTTQTGNYEVKLINDSEVAAKAKLEVSGVPTGMTAYVRESTSGTGNPVTSSTGWDLSMGETKTVYVYFTAASGVPSNKYDSITITPVFTQID